jgi:hypothetical protein
MKKYLSLTLPAVIAILCSLGFVLGKKNNSGVIDPAAQTQAIVKATTTFLNSLTAEQRSKIEFEFVYQKTATASRGSLSGGPGGGMGGRQGGTRPQGDSGRRQNMPPGGSGGGRSGGGGGVGGEQYGQDVWSNFPVSFVPRPGLKLGSLTAAQREAAINMLKELLSAAGYKKVGEIMGSDQVLADQGADFQAGNDNYLLAIFGKTGSCQTMDG